MRILCTLLIAFTMQLAGAPPQTNASKAGMDPARLAKIPVRIKSYVEQGTISGAVMLVQRHGALAELDAVGYQDLESKKPMKTDSIFQIMSMTKPVTSVAIMILVDEGLVSLSDPVEKYLPEFRGMWMIASQEGGTRTLKRPPRPIIVRDLLTHTSGMPPMPPEGFKDLLSKMDLTLAQAVAIYSQQPLEFEPGSKWSYSNPGIATLGRIVEVTSGQPFEKFLEERIFKPLGMTDSFIFPPAGKLDRIAMVYDLVDGKLRRAGPGTLAGDPAKFRKGAKYAGPEYGVYSTAVDLAAFYQMVLSGGNYSGGRILSRAAVDVMTALHTGNLQAGHTPGMGYGLAWTFVREPLGTLQLQSFGTYGHGGAFGTQGWVDPKKDLVGVFMMQRNEGGGNDESNTFKQMAAAAIVE